VLAVPDARKWQRLAVLAGLILIGTFFVPLGSLIDRWSHDTPARFLTQVIRHADGILSELHNARELAKLTFRFTLAVLPQIWGTLIVLISVMSLRDRQRLRHVPQAIGILLAVPIAAGWAVCVVYLMSSLLRNPRWDVTNLCWLALLITAFLIPVGGFVYALLAYRRRGWSHLYHGFVGAGSLVAMLLAFHLFAILDGGLGPHFGLTGLTITSVACCLLLFSRIGEARALTGLTWRWTLWYLLTLRLHKASRPVGLCPKCGYYLYGLREQRCPECGRPFSFEEVEATPETLGFAGEPSVFYGSLSEPRP